MQKLKRTCRNCLNFVCKEDFIKEREYHDISDEDFNSVDLSNIQGVCYEGGFSEIADADLERTVDDCNAWLGVPLTEKAHAIIDLVEEAIRNAHPRIEAIAQEKEENTLLIGETYYDLENEVVEELKMFIESPKLC